MSNKLKLQVMLKAVDRATRPFKATQHDIMRLSESIRATQDNIKALDAQAAQIAGFQKTCDRLEVMRQKLKDAKAEAAALGVQFRDSEKPTRAQARALDQARQAAGELQRQSNGLRLSVKQQRNALNAAGISTKNPGGEQQRLKSRAAMATVSLSRQQQELNRLNPRQEQLNRVKERYGKGREVSAKLRDIGSENADAAKSAVLVGASVLQPGYDLALANSRLQATLGLDKNAADFQSLTAQARSIGDNTSASASDAVQAQIIIAKSGGNVDDIKATTPVALDMSLANNRTVEENATLLMSTKNAFGLANSQMTHLGDVIGTTLNKTNGDFNGLRDALTSIAPAAKKAGVSVEQTTAMIGALAKSGTTGSTAGAEIRDMLLRVQAPTGEAFKAIDALKVKTSDGEGNMRPFFNVLKEIQQSFEKKHLDPSQQAEYLKTIFGEKAAPSAVTLIKAASGGLLDDLTKTFQHSDGSTASLITVQQDNLGGDLNKFQSAYEAIGIDLFNQQDSSLRQLTQDATRFLLKIDDWIKANPALAKGIGNIAAAGVALTGALGAAGLIAAPVMTGINAIIAGTGMLGTILSGVGSVIASAFGAITLAGAVVTALIVGGAVLIRKFWEPIQAFIAGAAEGFSQAMGPINDTLDPFSDTLKTLWGLFTDLLEPVKLTQTELATAGEMGKNFGNMLAEGLSIPGKALDQLRGGIDWVLKKLGIIDTQSDKLKDKLPENVPAVPDGQQYGPAGTGGAWRPVVTPAASLGYADRSQNSYQYDIHMHQGMTKDDALALMALHQEREQRNRQAQQRSKMGWED